MSDESNGWDLITGGIWMPVSAKWYAERDRHEEVGR